MNLQGYRDEFYTYSGKLSDLNRQLSFAGIAVIWLFKKDMAGTPTIPQPLIFPLLLIILSLVFDFLHYLLGTMIWRFFYRSREKMHLNETTEIMHSVWYERPIYFAFLVKLLLLITAYALIAQYLWRLWSS